jgi:hypothetical protein
MTRKKYTFVQQKGSLVARWVQCASENKKNAVVVKDGG